VEEVQYMVNMQRQEARVEAVSGVGVGAAIGQTLRS
jgi:hypothetical protein